MLSLYGFVVKASIYFFCLYKQGTEMSVFYRGLAGQNEVCCSLLYDCMMYDVSLIFCYLLSFD